jgi:cell division septal protein FtsQ
VKPSRRHRLAAPLRVLLFVPVLLGAAYLLYAGAVRAVSSQLLRVDRIVVRGNERLSHGEVLAVLTGLRGESVLGADLDRWRQRLLASPWVREAALRRSLPSTVEVMISERQPIGVGRFGDDMYLVDDHGAVIDQYGPLYADLDLPIIDGLEAAPAGGSATLRSAAEGSAPLARGTGGRPSTGGGSSAAGNTPAGRKASAGSKAPAAGNAAAVANAVAIGARANAGASADGDVPVLGNVSADGMPVSDSERGELAARVIAALRTKPEIARRLSQVDVHDLRNAQVLLAGDAAVVSLGDDRFLARLQNYLDLAPALRERVADIDHVDARFDNRIYVRPRKKR